MGYGVVEWTPDASEEGMRVNVDRDIYTFYDSSVVLFFLNKVLQIHTAVQEI